MLENTVGILKKNECSGCGACYQICPLHCISMVEDKEGFPYPKIDVRLCVECGKCKASCPQINVLKGSSLGRTYAMQYSDDSVLLGSSSGGAFSYFANEIIKRWGVVYGCAAEFGERSPIIHNIRADNARDVEKIRGSKYVYSSTEHTFAETRADLENGKWVLYTGTPCQIAGLRGFLNKEYETLITCEILCHGTPNQKIYRAYIQKLEEENGGKILSYQFRSKIRGWGLYYSYTYKENKTGAIKRKFGIADEDPYYISFLKAKNYRESCYECKYARPERVADITLGDYWGIELQHPGFADVKGISAIMLNTEKGIEFFHSISEPCKLLEVKREEVAEGNLNLYEPTTRPASRDCAYRHINDLAGDIFKNDPYALSGKQKFIAFLKKQIGVGNKWRLKRLFRKMVKKQ